MARDDGDGTLRDRTDRDGGHGPPRVTRRRFFGRGFELGVGAVALPLAVAACDEDEGADPSPPTDASGVDADGRDADAGDAGPDAGIDTPPDPIDPAGLDGAEPRAWDPRGHTQDDALFPMAVMAGATRSDRTVLQSGVALGRELDAVALYVWRESGSDLTDGEVGVVVEDILAPNEGGYLRQAVAGLAPATEYFYAFFTTAGSGAPDRRSLVGRVRTAWPEGWRAPLTLAATACTSQVKAPWPALTHMAARPYDVFCHLGDMVYADAAQTTDDYRAVWREALSQAGYRDALAVGTLHATLDDHEIEDSSQRYSLPDADYQTGLDAFFEAVPLDPHLVEGVPKLWQSFRWGATAEIFVLDCRTERSTKTLGVPGVEYVSRAQMDWLKQGLSDSPCHFKIVMTSVPITNLPQPHWVSTQDRWQGYPESRAELLDHILDEDIRNVWFLGGDFHLGAVQRVEREGPGRRLWEIVCGPGGPSVMNPLPNLHTLYDDPEQAAEVKAQIQPADQFAFLAAKEAATWLTFDPQRDAVRVVFETAGGEVLYDAEHRELDG